MQAVLLNWLQTRSYRYVYHNKNDTEISFFQLEEVVVNTYL